MDTGAALLHDRCAAFVAIEGPRNRLKIIFTHAKRKKNHEAAIARRFSCANSVAETTPRRWFFAETILLKSRLRSYTIRWLR
jgi:hypothetical protein